MTELNESKNEFTRITGGSFMHNATTQQICHFHSIQNFHESKRRNIREEIKINIYEKRIHKWTSRKTHRQNIMEGSTKHTLSCVIDCSYD